MKLWATLCMTWWFLHTAQSVSLSGKLTEPESVDTVIEEPQLETPESEYAVIEELTLEESDLVDAVWEKEPLEEVEMGDSPWEMLRYRLKKCNGMCTEDWDPVCGSDGKTYSNPCMFRYASCMKPEDNIVILHSEVCKIDKKCNGMCTKDWDPVCGSDGKTYSNPCMVRYASCMKPEDNIVILHSEVCKIGSLTGRYFGKPIYHPPRPELGRWKFFA